MTTSARAVWKLNYDFRRPCWQSFGHVLYVAAWTREQAVEQLGRYLAAAYPTATLERVEVESATREQAHRQSRKMRAYHQWMANVSQGVPNAQRSL